MDPQESYRISSVAYRKIIASTWEWVLVFVVCFVLSPLSVHCIVAMDEPVAGLFGSFLWGLLISVKMFKDISLTFQVPERKAWWCRFWGLT